MSLPVWFGIKQSCGCVRGVRICPTAEALWDAVADAHKDVARLLGNQGYFPAFQSYERALQLFNAHYEGDSEPAPAEQGAML